MQYLVYVFYGMKICRRYIVQCHGIVKVPMIYLYDLYTGLHSPVDISILLQYRSDVV